MAKKSRVAPPFGLSSFRPKKPRVWTSSHGIVMSSAPPPRLSMHAFHHLCIIAAGTMRWHEDFFIWRLYSRVLAWYPMTSAYQCPFRAPPVLILAYTCYYRISKISGASLRGRFVDDHRQNASNGRYRSIPEHSMQMVAAASTTWSTSR